MRLQSAFFEDLGCEACPENLQAASPWRFAPVSVSLQLEVRGTGFDSCSPPASRPPEFNNNF